MEIQDPDKRKVLSALCHGACFFSSTLVSIGIPIAILLSVDDPVIKDNAKEAINFQISIYIWAFIGVLLAFVLVGFAMLLGLVIFNFVAPIVAMVSVLSDPDRRYRYEGIFHFVE
ncbi:MAG: DUF4870 domain-containing protein [Cyanobacteria bacterium J06636_16]